MPPAIPVRFRPFLDKFLFEYEIVDAVVDHETGKIIELGRLYNFSSEGYEVGIYDTKNSNRSSWELNKPIFSISSPRPVPERIEYDGKCYFVKTFFRNNWTDVVGTWNDLKTGKAICFYLLTPDGKRIENS